VLTTTKLDPVQDDRILGKWSGEKEDVAVEIVRSGTGYRIVDEDAPTEFTLARAGASLFAQVPDKCSNHMFSFEGDTRKCYRLVRIEFGDGDFSMSQLSRQGFQDENDRNAVKIRHRIGIDARTDGDATICVLLHGTAEELAAVLAAYPKTAYEDAERILRVK
jgi:hypothetical protein